MKQVFELDDLLEADGIIARFNSLDLAETTLLKGGKPVDVDPAAIEKFELTGLSNRDFITSGYYLLKGQKDAKD